MERSAYPKSATKATLVEETLRRMRNFSPEMEWKEKGKALTKWALALKRSGHKERYRKEILRKAVARYRKELKEHMEGSRDLYRSREARKEQIREKGGKARAEDWFRRGGREGEQKPTSVFRVPVSQEGKLKEKVMRVMEEARGPAGVKAKVMEDGGTLTKNILVRGDPFPRKKCSREGCQIEGEECREKCYSAGVNYTVYCNRCDEKIEEVAEQKKRREERRQMEGNAGGQEAREEGRDDAEGREGEEPTRYCYAGETSRSLRRRMDQHNTKYWQKNNMMWYHTEEVHRGEIGEGRGKEDYRIEGEKKDRDPVRRVVRESVRIRRITRGAELGEYELKGTGRVRERRNRREGGGRRKEEKRKKIKVRIELMNGKDEFVRPGIVGVHLTQF